MSCLGSKTPLIEIAGPYGTITATDKIQRAWAELTALMRSSNTEMFESKTRTHEAIQNGTYMDFLEEYGPRLKEWKSKFDKTESKIPEPHDAILREPDHNSAIQSTNHP